LSWRCGVERTERREGREATRMRLRGRSVAYGPSSADEASSPVERIGRLSHDDARD
jgi:hypothetical protein